MWSTLASTSPSIWLHAYVPLLLSTGVHDLAEVQGYVYLKSVNKCQTLDLQLSLRYGIWIKQNDIKLNKKHNLHIQVRT